MVDDRENLQKFLASKNIPTIIHWPVPIAKSKPFGYLDGKYDTTKTDINSSRILSLPMHPYMTDSEIEFVCKNCKYFFKNEI